MSEPVKKSKSEKNKPLEFSCRRPAAVPKPQRAGLLKRVAETALDPRFNKEVEGEYDSKKFSSCYSFLNDYRQTEKQALESRLSARSTSDQEKIEISQTLKRITSQEAARTRLGMEQEIRDELRKSEKDLVASTGKKPYFHPRSVVKQMISERVEDKLRKSGQLDKFRAKKERRTIAKERVNFPRTRRVVEVDR